jgi:anion-transporting  ArsA/GET3 family ATPase
MSLSGRFPRLVVVVGAGGVGKTTLAAALGLGMASEGDDTLVMTFDPSQRLKQALGVEEAVLGTEAEVEAATPGHLSASLLDPRSTFDRLIHRYAPDSKSRDRILENRYYNHLAGSLAGNSPGHTSHPSGARFPRGAAADCWLPGERRAANRPEELVR